MYIRSIKKLLCVLMSSDPVLNATIEERVSLLEIQVVEIQEDVTDVDERVTLVEENVNFLFDEQVIQDERLLTLEGHTDAIEEQLFSIYGELDSKQGLCEKYDMLFCYNLII